MQFVWVDERKSMGKSVLSTSNATLSIMLNYIYDQYARCNKYINRIFVYYLTSIAPSFKNVLQLCFFFLLVCLFRWLHFKRSDFLTQGNFLSTLFFRLYASNFFHASSFCVCVCALFTWRFHSFSASSILTQLCGRYFLSHSFSVFVGVCVCVCRAHVKNGSHELHEWEPLTFESILDSLSRKSIERINIA